MSTPNRPRTPPGLIVFGLLTFALATFTGSLALAQAPAQPPSTPAPAGAPVGTPVGAAADASAEADAPEAETGGKWSRLLERLLFNPRERTVRGLDAVERARSEAPAPAPGSGAPSPPAGASDPRSPSDPVAGPSPASPLDSTSPNVTTDAERAAEAIGPFDSAARLLERDALATYNAGTARLLSERADAAPLLESVLESGDDRLASNAAFNLGNSHLETGQLQGAVDAFKQSLRRDPMRTDAKHNLEIAMRRLREQQQQQQNQQNQQNQNQDQGDQEQQDQDQEQQGDQEQQDQDQEQQGDQEQQDQQQQDQQQGDQEQQDQDQEQQGDQEQQDQQTEEGEQEQQPQEGEQGEQEERPLPQFEDQPDMTAEEAAAILEAVENLEREARRQEALEAARKQAKGKKDW